MFFKYVKNPHPIIAGKCLLSHNFIFFRVEFSSFTDLHKQIEVNGDFLTPSPGVSVGGQ